MKNSRKCIFKSIVCMLLSIIIIGTSSIYSSAATTSYKKVSSITKVGSYYIWVDEYEGLYVMKSGSSKKLIVRQPYEYGTEISVDLVTNGSKIYYSVITDKSDDKDYGKIYRIDVSGKNKKFISKVSHLSYLNGYYNNKLYISIHDSDSYASSYAGDESVYSCNVKTGKTSLIKRNCYVISQSGKYLLLETIALDYEGMPIYCYNASTNKKYKITSEGGTASFVNGKIYYSYIRDTYSKHKEVLKSCSYTGKNQKTIKIFNFENGGNISSINKTNVEYAKYNRDHTKTTMYKYYYKTGKTVKIKQL